MADGQRLSHVPPVKKIGSETVIFASGTLGIRKILATGKAFESLSFMPYPGYEEKARKAGDQAVAELLVEFDAGRRAKDEVKLLDAIGGFERLGVTRDDGINGVYNLFDRDGFHYCVFGGTKGWGSGEKAPERSPQLPVAPLTA